MEFETEFDVNLAIYAEYPCLITYATYEEAQQIVPEANWNPLI